MIRFSLIFLLGISLGAVSAPASDSEILSRSIDAHILPGFGRAAATAERLAEVAGRSCDPDDAELLEAFEDGWDAWIAVSHLRFGPTETADRAFAMGFWPDTRGAVPKALSALIAAQDPAVADQSDFAQVSIAARGYTALEFLLFDPAFDVTLPYGCTLMQAVARDIAANSSAILSDWQGAYGESFRNPGPDAVYRSPTEALGAVYGAMTTGLEFTVNARLGRPLGTFERPRPNRAEARRSGRSLQHVLISVQSTGQLAQILSSEMPVMQEEIDATFDRAVEAALGLGDPDFSGVSTPAGRLKVEILQQRINEARDSARLSIGPALGIAEGFNSLDGD